jgi:hypothetical protein
MSDDTHWSTPQAELRELVEHLRPEEALEIIRKLVRSPEANMAPALYSLIRGYAARRASEQRPAE